MEKVLLVIGAVLVTIFPQSGTYTYEQALDKCGHSIGFFELCSFRRYIRLLPYGGFKFLVLFALKFPSRNSAN